MRADSPNSPIEPKDMMTVTIHDVEQRSEEWYALRRGIVTASNVGKLIVSASPDPRTIDCPACNASAGDPCVSRARREPTEIATVHQVRTALAATLPPVLKVADNETSRGLTLSLVAERITGRTDDSYQSRDMLRGVLDEPLAREVYAENYAPVTECGFMTREIGDYVCGFSPDGLVGDDGLIEIKSKRQRGQVDTVLSGDVPAEHMAQMQMGLLVSGRHWCDFVSYSSGMHLYVVRVFADPAWLTVIDEAVQFFGAHANILTRAYQSAVEGLPMTEYVDHFEEVSF